MFCWLGLAFVAQSQAQRPPGIGIAPTASLFEQALTLYSELTGRTILRYSILPATLTKSDLERLPTDTNAIPAFVENEFRQNGILIIPDGNRFAWVVPTGWTNSAAAKFLSTIQPPLPGKEVISAGAVTFAPATTEQVLAIYSEYNKRTLLRPVNLGSPHIHLRNIRPMTGNELSYAMRVCLAINGIAAVDDGEKFVQLVPIQMLPLVVTNTPKPTTNAVALDPKEVSKIKPEPLDRRVLKLNQYYRRFFRGTPPWTPRPLGRLADFYGELTDQTFVPTKDFDGTRMVLCEVTTPLTKEELIYAVETVLRLNGWEIGKAGKAKFSLFRLGAKQSSDQKKKQ